MTHTTTSGAQTPRCAHQYQTHHAGQFITYEVEQVGDRPSPDDIVRVLTVTNSSGARVDYVEAEIVETLRYHGQHDTW